MLYTDANFLHMWVTTTGPTKEVQLDSTHSKCWDNLFQVRLLYLVAVDICLIYTDTIGLLWDWDIEHMKTV